MTLHEQYKEDIKGSTTLIQLYIRQSYLNSIDCMIAWNGKHSHKSFIDNGDGGFTEDYEPEIHLKQQRELIANEV